MLAGWIAIEYTSRFLRSGRYDLPSLGDFLINLTRSRIVLAHGQYDEHFYYPLPFVLLQEGIAALPLPVAAWLWWGLAVGSWMVALWLALDALSLSGHRWRGPLTVVAVLSVAYFVQWDLRAGNFNGAILALVLLALRLGGRGRDPAAGAVLAAAIALKLYAAVLLPYLAWRGRWRWLAFSAAGCLVLFVIWPALRLGPTGAWSLTASWLGHLLDPGPPLSLPDYYKPLERSLLLWLTEAGSPSERVATLAQDGVVAVARALQVAWVGVVGWSLARNRAVCVESERSYLDAVMLMMLPLPFSPTFQVHHAVVLVLSALWMVRIAADPDDVRARRLASVAVLATAALLVKWLDDWPGRAVGVFVAIAIHAGGLLALPPRGASASGRAEFESEGNGEGNGEADGEPLATPPDPRPA